MTPINPFSFFSLRSPKRAMNIPYTDFSMYFLRDWLLLNVEGVEREIPAEIARKKYECIYSRLEEVKQLFAEMGQSELILRESNLPLSLFTYLYLYLQSTVSARVAENPETHLLELWHRTEAALFHMSQEESEESASVVKECIDALFIENRKIMHFFHKLVEIALRDSNYMSCSLGFLMGMFQEEESKEKEVEFTTALGARTLSLRSTKSVLMDVQIFVQALYDSYKKIPERIEAFRHWLVNHIEKLEGLPEAVTRRQLLSWKEGINSLELEILPLITAGIENFPSLLLETFTFRGEPYTMEKIIELLSRYQEDLEGVMKKIHERSFQDETTLRINSSGCELLSDVLTSYLDNLPNSIDTLEQMSAVLEKKIVPHPAYFACTGAHFELMKQLKEFLEECGSEEGAARYLVEHYELTTNSFETFRLSTGESTVSNPYPHIYEYQISRFDLDASISFEEEVRAVRKAFETYVGLTLVEIGRFVETLQQHRALLQGNIDAVNSRLVPAHQQKRQACAQRTVQKFVEDFDELLRNFKPYAWLESPEDVKTRQLAEELLKEEMQIIAPKKGKKNQRGKKNTPERIQKSIKEKVISPLEQLQKQIIHSKKLLESAAFRQADDFMQAACLQARISLSHLGQAASYTSIFSAKVWLPIFLEEGYLAIEQTLKGIFPQIEDRTFHGLKLLLEQSGQEEFIGNSAVENLDRGYVTSYRFLDVHKEAKKAQQWFSDYKKNPLIFQGMEGLDEVKPTEILIYEAKQVANLVEAFLVSGGSNSKEQREEEPLERFPVSLPFVSLALPQQIRIKPFIQRRQEVEAHLQKAFVFDGAVSEILQHLNSQENTFTKEEIALYCKELLFFVTKSVEFVLHAILTGQNNTAFSCNHNLNELFSAAFPSQTDKAQQIDDILGNAHLCLRYPLQKRRVYSAVHRVSLAASEVFSFQARTSENIFEQLHQDEQTENLPLFLQEQTASVLLFVEELYKEHLLFAVEAMASVS